MWASPYFRYQEFDSPDEPGSGIHMDTAFIGRLERVREKCGFPFVVTSGYRTPSHNAKVGGKSRSAHLRGYAADISITTDRQRFMIVRAAMEFGFRRIEVGRNWVHLDVDPDLPQDIIYLP